MKVLLLGGAGLFGKAAGRLLAGADPVTEIAIASRRLETAQRAASELGDRARAVRVDIKDQPGLTSVSADYDVVVNAAGPTFEVQIPALRAAIEAGTDYCDLGISGNSAERALQLDSQARANAVTAVIGIGTDPGLSNLLAVHAARQLDETEELKVCYHSSIGEWGPMSPEMALDRFRKSGRLETSWPDILESARGPVLTYRGGRWVRVEPIENPVEVVHPLGRRVTAYPSGNAEPVTLPRFLPGLKSASVLVGFFPPQLNALYLQQGRRIANGEVDALGATVSFFETIVGDKTRWLSGPDSFPSVHTIWVTATGWKGGRRAGYACWPDALPYMSTDVSLVVGARRILRGEVDRHGVLAPEACFDPKTFFAEVVKLRPPTSQGPLLGESFQWLDGDSS